MTMLAKYLLSNVLRRPDDGGADAAPIDVVQIQNTGDNAVMSARDAARTLAGLRHKRTDEPNSQARAAPEPAADEPATPSGDEPDAAAADPQPPGDQATESAIDPAQQPTIEPPRSWTKEAKDRWQSLPRETQEYLAEREQERDRELRRGQNDAAEKLKGLTAKEQAVEQARTHYETMVPALLQTLQQQQAGQFSDIKTMEDVSRLAQTDWPRYVMWDAQQKQIAAVQNEVAATGARQAQEKQQKLAEFVTAQAKLFAEKAPEIADDKQRASLQGKAVKMLGELGFTDADLAQSWNGEKDISIHDHRLQLLIRDAVKYRDAQAAAKTATIKPVPPVQRPGVSQPRGSAQDAVVHNLDKRFNQTHNAKDAARLLMERRKAAAR